jgi:hypothetical protein
MGVRVKDNGQFKEIYVKALDSLPVGAEIDFDGDSADIPDGWELVGNNYSTDEIKTGKTWIDGKPIYRKVIQASNIGTAFGTGVSNIDTFMFDVSHSYIYYNSNIFFASDRAAFLYNKADNTIVTENTALATWSAKITIEYTKTTD